MTGVRTKNLLGTRPVTGSADGLGRAAAQTLLEDGHEVVVHARSHGRLAAVGELLEQGAEAVVGDLSELEQTRDLADEVNRLRPLDAVIHNAGVMTGSLGLPVNVIAPYVLSALIKRPRRLIDLSSGMHRGGHACVEGIDWSGQTATSDPGGGGDRRTVDGWRPGNDPAAGSRGELAPGETAAVGAPAAVGDKLPVGEELAVGEQVGRRTRGARGCRADRDGARNSAVAKDRSRLARIAPGQRAGVARLPNVLDGRAPRHARRHP